MIKKQLFFLISIIFVFMIQTSSSNSKYEKLFFDHKINLINGIEFKLTEYDNHVVLLVNTASFCGFTKQYSDLQKLWELYKERNFVILAVPSNSFNQEKDDNKEIKDFCETKFNITFPISSLSNVKGKDAHEIYKWAKFNYGNSAVPKWNFHKILIGRNGKIIDTFAPFTNPLSKKIIKAIDSQLN